MTKYSMGVGRAGRNASEYHFSSVGKKCTLNIQTFLEINTRKFNNGYLWVGLLLTNFCIIQTFILPRTCTILTVKTEVVKHCIFC